MEVQQRCVIYMSRMALYICWCMETICFSQWWHVHLLFWYVVHNQWKRTKNNGKERNRLETGHVETISSVTNIVNIHCQYSWTFAKRSSTGIFQIWLFDQLCVLALESNEFMAKRVTKVRNWTEKIEAPVIMLAKFVYFWDCRLVYVPVHCYQLRFTKANTLAGS